MPNLERHEMESPYHYCQKCWRRFPLDQLTWQRGFLVCKDWDYDTLLIGDRELAISRVLNTGSGADTELMPDKKLTNPSDNGIIEDILL